MKNMGIRRLLFFAVFIMIAATLIVGFNTKPLVAADGFYISGRNLMDANGNQFIIRGISHAHCWYTSRTAQALADIKAVGANSVRVVCSNGREGWTKTTAADLTSIINQCKTNKLICIPELHDTTGYGENSNAISLQAAASYWNSVKSALVGQEKYVIINIGNEPYGNNNYANWVNDTKAAIQSMRSNGFTHTLMVDAPNWGQDWAFVMRDNAQAILDADTLKNTILSVHMYGVFDTAAEITSYISAFTSKNWPLVVGEFGHNHSDGNPDEDTIMSATQQSGIGWMAWSWCGNSGGVEYLDLVNNWSRTSPSSWGTRVFTGANGLSTTSRECSVFSGSTAVPNTPTPVRTATPVVTSTPRRTATPRVVVTPTPVIATPTPRVTQLPATPTPVPPVGSIKIQFYNQNTSAISNQIYLNMKIINTGGSPVALSNVKVRYYYTIDGVKPQNFWCDWSPSGSGNVNATFATVSPAKTGVDTYVELGFSSGAGSLAANGGSTTVQARVAKNDWTNYTQSDDYSFNSSATTFVDWTKVTAYVSGSLQWGVEP
jgi:mannan endo-1,4-beta-mannosidase